MNQVERWLNEAKPKVERLPYTYASHAEIRDLAVLVFDMADQIQGGLLRNVRLRHNSPFPLEHQRGERCRLFRGPSSGLSVRC